MSGLWFGQSFRLDLYFASASSHIAVYDRNLNQGMLLEQLQPVWTQNTKIKLRDLFVQEHWLSTFTMC